MGDGICSDTLFVSIVAPYSSMRRGRASLLNPPLHTHQANLYCEHVVCQRAMEAVLSSSKVGTSMRKTRKKGGTVDDARLDLGYRSYKRGDVVVWVGEESTPVAEICETVFACMVLDHRGQQRRFLITYSARINKFSVNAWTSWERKLAVILGIELSC